MKAARKILNRTETYVIAIALVFGMIVQGVSGQFFSNTGMINLMRASMVYLVFGVAEMMALVSSGPDVSYPAIASLSTFITARLFATGDYSGSVLIPFLFAIVIGAACGAVNGLIIAKFDFPSLIVTLGTSSIFSGLMYGPLKASNTILHGVMAQFGSAGLFTSTNSESGLTAALPAQFLIVIAVYAIMFFVLKYTMFGRGLYAVGADTVSAQRAGFKTGKIRFFSFVIGGMLAALGGMMYSCNVGAIAPSDLLGGEMIVIAACILGGVRPGQGVGGLFNVVIGIVLLTMIQNNLLMLGIPLYWNDIFTGIIILLGTIVSISSLRTKAPKKAG